MLPRWVVPPLGPRFPGWSLLALGMLVLLVLITWQVVDDGALLVLDERARDAVPHRGADEPVRPWAAELLADLGGTLVAGPVLAAAALGSAWWNRRRDAVRWWLPLVWAAVAGAAVPLLVVPMKAVVGREGPDGTLDPGQLGFYPSGHTATAAVCYGAAVLLAPAGRRGLTWAAAALNAAVGVALVWCGYHWALDVVAAWCLSGTVLLALRAGLAGPGGGRVGRGRAVAVSGWSGNPG
ncbi:hypothetical protein AQ490_02115 [Wenjunlia vitaminophila]|uniref:Phosphatidic acid phosphatase type 2/haloperoxidase domain-containing protein n=1 Tax=Wenjunlia vitaminophila TaxID=76728 RepID=A0A0T6LYH5_WENVI|nr:phosphatase PAP2 family protein [Wenjunlia vitaminophila]KRV51024.1 hypothetical protein AQ490_02115 [Wenjunlia vitaminophila]